ncbi:hypothetical protein D9M73_147080 [compost metagenome]
MHRRFQVTAVAVVRIARQATTDFQRLAAAAQDGHTVPRCLALPEGAVAGCFDITDREGLVQGFELLQANHIGLFALKPGQEVGQVGADAGDIECGDA